jgi:hypothetical protein
MVAPVRRRLGASARHPGALIDPLKNKSAAAWCSNFQKAILEVPSKTDFVLG